MRPVGGPRWDGLRSENAAHRMAVEWDDTDGVTRTGVYIPRRDSDSWTNVALGGRIFPGRHHRARFDVSETNESIHVAFATMDGSVDVDVAVHVTDQLDGSSLFCTLAAASGFFEAGSVGYSATRASMHFDGLQLRTSGWKVEAAAVAQLDSVLVMRQVPVDWLALGRLNAARADRVAPRQKQVHDTGG
jgi:hypothetical protein